MRATHLPAERLERYLAAELPPCDAERVADHLRDCLLCTARFHRLKADRAVMARAAAAALDDTLEPTANMPAASRLREAIRAISHTTAGAYLATQLPPGVTVHRSLLAAAASVREAAWSPDGGRLAELSDDGTIRVWPAEDTEPAVVFQGMDRTGLGWSSDSTALTTPGCQWDLSDGSATALGAAKARVWSPDGGSLATIKAGGQIVVSRADQDQPVILTRRPCAVTSLAWCSDSETLAAGYDDGLIRIWKTRSGAVAGFLGGHTGPIHSLVWTRDGLLYSGGFDGSIRSWDTGTFRMRAILGRHPDMITAAVVSADQRLLLSVSLDGTLSIWSTADGTLIASCRVSETAAWYTLASHPELPLVAIPVGRITHTLDLAVDRLIAQKPSAAPEDHFAPPHAHSVMASSDGYAIALVSGTGMGKTMCFTQVMHRLVVRDDGTREHQEIRLLPDDMEPAAPAWGLPDVDVIVLFDAPGRAELEQRYRSLLRWSQQIRRPWEPPVVRVAIDPAPDHIAAFDAVLQSRGKGKTGERLANLLYQRLQWDQLPRIRSRRTLERIRACLDERRRQGRIFTTVDSLYREYARQHVPAELAADAHQEFRNAIRILEKERELTWNTWSGMILLRPDLLVQYSRAVASAIRQQGRLNRESVESGRFRIPDEHRIAEPQLERLFLEQITRLMLRQRAAYPAEQPDGSQFLVSVIDRYDWQESHAAYPSDSFLDECLARKERLSTVPDQHADWFDVVLANAVGVDRIQRVQGDHDICFIGTGENVRDRITRLFHDAYVADPIPGITWRSPDRHSGQAVLEAGLDYLEDSLATMRPSVIVTTSPIVLGSVMALFLYGEPFHHESGLPSWRCRAIGIKEYGAVVVQAGDPAEWTEQTRDHLNRLIAAAAS